MITVTFQCATKQELMDEMLTFLNETPRATDVAQVQFEPLALTFDRVRTTAVEALEGIEKKPVRKRRTKEEMAAKAEPEQMEMDYGRAPQNEGLSPLKELNKLDKVPKTPTRETVHQALQQVNVAVGLNKAREILSAFNVNRVSEIQETDYVAFVEKCNLASTNA